jgi:hypothetical protein
MYIVHILIVRSKSARSKENAPHEAGHYLNLGGPGRNRTTDTRIFNSPIDRTFAFCPTRLTPPESNFVHKIYMRSCKRLNWLSYFDPRKECGQVWCRSGDLTDTRMSSSCLDRGTPCMKCPFKGRFYEFFKLLCHI